MSSPPRRPKKPAYPTDSSAEDDDHAQWGFGEEDDLDDDGDGYGQDSDSASEYLGSDDDGRPVRAQRGPQLGEAGPSRLRDGDDDDAGMDATEAGQFDRLVASIRTGNNLSGSEVLTQNWDQSAEDPDAESTFDKDFRSAVAGPGRRRKRAPGTRRREPELDPEIQQLLGQGNMFYVMQDYAKAIETYQSVIMQEPAVHVAWTTLATCHQELGNNEKALQCEMMAAHLRPTNDVWKDLGAKSRASGTMDQAIYCYKKAVACNPDDVDAIWDYAYLLRETGQHAKAIEGFQTILQHNPHDIAVILEMSNSFVEASLLPLGQRLILNALHRQQKDYPDPADPFHPIPPDVTLFPVALLVKLFDILIATEQWAKAISETKRAVRWLGGRLKETRWDKIGDDREFDEEGVRRDTRGEDECRAAEGYPLDINLRERLGLARLNLGDIDEARMHFNIIRKLDPEVYQILWGEIGDAYLAKSMFDDALEYFEPLSELTSLPKHVEGRGDCLRANEDYEGAKESYLFVISSFDDEADPASLKVRMKLAYVYEKLDQRQEALDLVNSVLDIRRNMPVHRARRRRVGDEHRVQVDATGSILSRGGNQQLAQLRAARLNREQIENNHIARVEAGFARLDALDEFVEEEDVAAIMEWLDVAGPLIEGFRETKPLFPQDRKKKFVGVLTRGRGRKQKTEAEKREEQEAREEEEAEAEAEGLHERLQKDIEGEGVAEEDALPEATSLRGVSLDKWFDTMIKYCCLCAKYDDPDHAFEVADHLQYAAVFRSPARQQTLRLTGVACVIALDDPIRIAEQARKLMMSHQFSDLALHLMVSSLGTGLKPAEALANVNLQKFLARDLRVWEHVVKGGDMSFHGLTGRWAIRRTKPRKPNLSANLALLERKEKEKEKQGKGKGKIAATVTVGGAGDDLDDDEGEEGEGEGGNGAQDDPAVGKTKPVLPDRESAVLMAYFGMIMCLGRSFQSSIFYLLRAHDIVPQDPLVCLCLAIAYVGRAFQRQCDNRNYCIVTAMTFLDRYRKLHPDGEEAEEVDFNFGTLFHRMGLFFLAIPHLKRILDRAEEKGGAYDWRNDPKTLVRETAYNLSLIYGICGIPHAARDVTRKWLTI